MKQIKIVLFTASTDYGRELACLLRDAVNSKFLDEFVIELTTFFDADSEDMMISGLQDDIIIFDASVEDDIGSNYRTTKMWPLCMDHFFVVSRTRLPINFKPFHEGGSPDTWNNLLERPFSLSNQQIVSWIQEQLKLLTPYLPRPEDERLEIPKGQFAVHAQAVGKLTVKLINQSLERREIYRRNSGQAFISYLSKYSRHHRQAVAVNGLYVEDLVKYIKDYHDNTDFSVLYYPPGSLSSEFMAEYRRWQVVRMIEDRIRAADEFWIFETDDYYNSWWTQAELAVLAYILYDDEHPLFGKRPPPKIFICKPNEDKELIVREADATFIQKLDETTARELGRCLSNNEAYESIRWTQITRRLPLPIQWLLFHAGKYIQIFLKIIVGFSLASLMSKEEWKQANFEIYRRFIKSRAFSQEFWTDRIVTCPSCSKSNEAQHNFDFQSFLTHNSPGQYRISPEELSSALDNQQWNCNTCGFQFQIIKETNPQFRWWAARLDRPTGPEGVYIEKIPLYSLQRKSL